LLRRSVPCVQGYVTADVADKEGLHRLNLSGTKFRKMLRGGEQNSLPQPPALALPARLSAAGSSTAQLAPAFAGQSC
jgi:hypothetical protein